MKRTIALLLALVLLLALGAPAWAEDKPAEEPAAEETRERLTKEEIIRMSNFMNGNDYSVNGTWQVYETSSDNGFFGRIYNRRSGESVSLGENASYIIPDGLYVIYMNWEKNSFSSDSIKRTRVTGGNSRVLISKNDIPDTQTGVFQFLQEYDGHLYFAFNNESGSTVTGGFYRADMDGTHIKKILDKAVYYPYFVGGRLYYQDDADDCRLHVCNPDGSGDSVFIDDFCYEFITDGEVFFYDSYDKPVEWDDYHRPVNENSLRRVLKMYSPETGIRMIEGFGARDIAYDGEKVYFSEPEDSWRLYSYDPQTEAIDAMYLQKNVNLKIFTGSNSLRCMITNSNNYYEKYMTAALDGTSFK